MVYKHKYMGNIIKSLILQILKKVNRQIKNHGVVNLRMVRDMNVWGRFII